APVYAPNSGGRDWSDTTGPAEDGWETDTEMVRSAYELHPEDDDFSQPGELVRNVMDEAQRDAEADQVSGSLLDGVDGEVLDGAVWYGKGIEPAGGKRIEVDVKTNGGGAGAGSTGPGIVVAEDVAPCRRNRT